MSLDLEQSRRAMGRRDLLALGAAALAAHAFGSVGDV